MLIKDLLSYWMTVLSSWKSGKDEEQGLIHTIIVNSGTLKNKKGVNVPGVSVQLPGMTEKDTEDILFGIEARRRFHRGIICRRASDVMEIRALLERKNGADLQIIPKIENREGVDNMDEILNSFGRIDGCAGRSWC